MQRTVVAIVLLVLVVGAWFDGGAPSIRAADCNQNGVEDSIDLTDATSLDCNANGVPDECDLVAQKRFATQLGSRPATLTTGGNPSRAVAVDLDGDGDLEVVVTRANLGERNLLVFPNAGDGSFLAPVPIPVGEPQWGIDAGDLDGDGDPDLAVTLLRADQVVILWNQMNLRFTPSPPLPAGVYPEELMIRDLDQDGDLDLAVRNALSRDVSIFENLSAEGQPGVFAPRLCCSGAGGLELSDLDNDGDLDLVGWMGVDSSTGSVHLWPNGGWCSPGNGDGTFGASVMFPSGGSVPHHVAAGDLNGDGAVDLIVAHLGSDDLVVHLNAEGDCTGPPAFVAMPAIPVAGGGPLEPQLGADPKFVELRDLDWDGDLDLMVPNQRSNDVAVFCNNGDATFGSPERRPVGRQPCFARFADLDGDEDIDAVILNVSEGTVSLLWMELESFSQDCNANGVPDECDIAGGADVDVNDNGVPDGCECPAMPPEIECPTDIVVNCEGLDGAIVDFDLPVATDACAAEPVVTCDPPSGSVFPIGETIVRCTATDRSGNVTECRFNVVVICLVLPCDYNQDGVFDLSDPVALLNHLFLGGPPPACGDRTIFDPSNIALLDCNGDSGVDLSDAVCKLNYLFLGGAPPFPVARALGAGRRCIAVPNCESACVESHP